MGRCKLWILGPPHTLSPMKLWMSWSSGKDSALALHYLRQNPETEVVGLLTTVNETYDRVAMHAVRDELLELQAKMLSLPLHKIKIPSPCTNEVYEAKMQDAITEAKRQGITEMGFGDLFLADIRAYREKMLAGTGITPHFPLWKIPTDHLAKEMLESGVRAVVTCVDPRKLPKEFAGREFDRDFLSDLPGSVDPCGEYGEFHTFVYDAPEFKNPISVEVGEIVERDGFVFADVVRKPFGQKKCERCGSVFTCGAEEPKHRCWCMDLPSLKDLPKDVSDCLCRKCLEQELAR